MMNRLRGWLSWSGSVWQWRQFCNRVFTWNMLRRLFLQIFSFQYYCCSLTSCFLWWGTWKFQEIRSRVKTHLSFSLHFQISWFWFSFRVLFSYTRERLLVGEFPSQGMPLSSAVHSGRCSFKLVLRCRWFHFILVAQQKIGLAFNSVRKLSLSSEKLTLLYAPFKAL